MSDLFATLTALIVDNWEMLDALAVAVGLVIYVVASHTLHQRRHPSAAIAWVLGILLVPYNPIETFGNRVDALLSDVKETENFRGLPDEARDAIKTKLQELVDVMQTYHVRSVEKGGDE